MSVRAAKSLFIVPSLKRCAGFYQELLEGLSISYSNEALSILGNKLTPVADYAYTIREMEVVAEVSRLLSNFPSIEYQSIGRYYQALCIQRQRRFDEAIGLLECVSNRTPLKYRARAVLTLGAIHKSKSNFEEALRFRIEASRMSKQDLFTLTESQRGIAILKSIDGDHKGALNDLERVWPLVRIAGSQHPPLYYDYLNSLAVEMGEVGRKEEANNICKVVLASPFAFAYPEWRETSDDIERKGYRSPRSFVSLNHRLLSTKNILHLSVAEPSGNTGSEKYHRNPFQQASITDLQEWKRKMVKEPNGNQNDKEDLKNATEKDLYLKLMELMAKRDLTAKQLYQVIDFVESISSKPDPNSGED